MILFQSFGIHRTLLRLMSIIFFNTDREHGAKGLCQERAYGKYSHSMGDTTLD